VQPPPQLSNAILIVLKQALSKDFIFFEINENQNQGVSKLLIKAGFYDIELKKDFRSKNRMIKASL
jgi:methylase of polypeptide subunit release factors